jgi:hypothetical protein
MGHLELLGIKLRQFPKVKTKRIASSPHPKPYGAGALFGI